MKRRLSLNLEATPEAAIGICTVAVRRLGWELDSAAEKAPRLRAFEDPARLCCVASPAEVAIEAHARTGGGSELALEIEVPGYGPVAGRQLRSRASILLEQIDELAPKPV